MGLNERNKERFKYDPIDYYKIEMDWFAFSFVMMTLYVYLTLAIILRYDFIMKKTDLVIVGILGATRLAMLHSLKIRN